MAKYQTIAAEQGAADLAAWFGAKREALAGNGDIGGPAAAAVTAALAEMTADPAGIEAVGAFSRWPPQSGRSVEDYLDLWIKSCAELGASPRRPTRLRTLLIGYAHPPTTGSAAPSRSPHA